MSSLVNRLFVCLPVRPSERTISTLMTNNIEKMIFQIFIETDKKYFISMILTSQMENSIILLNRLRRRFAIDNCYQKEVHDTIFKV